MSKNSSPGRSMSDAFDNYYDSDFTAQISSKMHVPDKISVIEGVENSEMIFTPNENAQRYMMHVPERILVAGDNKHIAGREQLPELRLESAYQMNRPSFVLQAPPNVLTVDELSYPPDEYKTQIKKEIKQSLMDQPMNGVTDLNESSISAIAAPEEEILMLRRQIRHLSRRVLTIEQDSQQRQQRDVILYAMGVIYFTFKGLLWLHRHF